MRGAHVQHLLAQPCPGAGSLSEWEQDQAPGAMVQGEPVPQTLFQSHHTAGWRDLSPRVLRFGEGCVPAGGCCCRSPAPVLTLISY